MGSYFFKKKKSDTKTESKRVISLLDNLKKTLK